MMKVEINKSFSGGEFIYIYDTKRIGTSIGIFCDKLVMDDKNIYRGFKGDYMVVLFPSELVTSNNEVAHEKENV